MRLTEAKIKEAQAVIEAVMEELSVEELSISDTSSIGVDSIWFVLYLYNEAPLRGDSLSGLYINRLHELNGTNAPPF